MGCMYSRGEFENANPKTFQVWNVDGDGRRVKPGRIEVTESQLVLYQKGDLTVRWPLRSLRRYGFDEELFSFECGRRCPTGPGVYAFRCARAEALFNILQGRIHHSSAGSFSGAGNISIAAIEDRSSLSTTMSSVANTSSSINNIRQTTISTSSPAVDSDGYLEPITATNHNCATFNSNINRSENSGSSTTGFTSIHPGNVSSQSTQWTAATTRHVRNSSGCCSFGTCKRTTVKHGHHYVNDLVFEQLSTPVSSTPEYVNASAATLNSQSLPAFQHQSKNTYVNSLALGLNPGLSRNFGYCNCNANCFHCVDVNTNYAKLDDLLKQEQSAKRQKEQNEHFYMNVKPERSFRECHSRTSSAPISHFYSNLTTAPSESDKKSKAASSFQVNYAVLDLDKLNNTEIVGQPKNHPENNATSTSNSALKSPDGYAQIDFNKTEALSHSSMRCFRNDESIRKTRHNAVIP